MSLICAAFCVSSNGLMLKAPHYAFGLVAYARAFHRIRVIFTHRSPFSVAASMLKHPHISRQLPLGARSRLKGRPLPEEAVHVRGKFLMMLPEEAMRGIGIDFDLRVRDQSGHDVGEARRQHPIVIAARDECGLLDRG
jgi:hypothetical protein